MADLTVKVPDVGEGIAEVELVSWAVAEGQTVARNDVIAEVMTDKATVEVPAPADGVIGGLAGEVGDILLVGSPLFSLQLEAGAIADSTPAAVTPAPAAVAPTPAANTVAPAANTVAPAAVAPGAPTAAAPAGTPRQLAVVRAPDEHATAAKTTSAPRQEGRKPTASPAVRRRARDAGIDLRSVTGSGPAGRISHADLDGIFEATPSQNGSTTADRRSAANQSRDRSGPDTTVTDNPIVGIRRRIAEQMVASTSSIPHITYVEEIDMTALEDLRHTLNVDRPEGQQKLTILPFLIRAMVNELVDFPAMNAHVLDPAIPEQSTQPQQSAPSAQPGILRTFAGVHVGIATQTDRGLVVPVLRHAEAETLWTSATRIVELAESARTGSAAPNELSGSTITITSLGALGGLMTTPVINKPETTIVGVNKMVTRPVWDGDAFQPRKMMNLSCSFDHRVIDGWDAANFVQALKRSLEQPALLFVERA